MSKDDRLPWPSLKSYGANNLRAVSMPMGGIGTGTLGLGGRGDLRDFEIGNRPSKGFRPGTAFLAIQVENPDGSKGARLLEGPIDDSLFEGPVGAIAANHGLPRYRNAEFAAAYPLGQVQLTDPEMPRVTLRGFNPMIPTVLDDSSLPVAIISVDIHNDSSQPLSAGVVVAIENFVGALSPDPQCGENQNHFSSDGQIASVQMIAPTLPFEHEGNGTFAISVLNPEKHTTHRTGWLDADWGNTLLDFWDDFAADGRLDGRESAAGRPVASLCKSVEIGPHSMATVTFLLTWRFPNRPAWAFDGPYTDQGSYSEEIVGNHYAGLFADAVEVAKYVADNFDDLESRTVRAVRAILDTTTPESIKEAALFNLNNLRSQTVFRVADGRFFAWEGLMNDRGSCFGTCSHVWGYEFATSALYPEIARSFRETQYLLATDERGFMPFRIGLPISKAGTTFPTAAADGQMACLVHLYYDWKLSGDLDALGVLWPHARRSLEFAWIPGGWDANMDGVMEGAQHNTMDVEYFGPNPQVGTWYLAALRACEEMARAVGDSEFAETCARLFHSGSVWIDEELFNGRYYEQQISVVGEIAPGLQLPPPPSPAEAPPPGQAPASQLGKGILIDQLVGQYAARVASLGDLLDKSHIKTALDTVVLENSRPDFYGHFNHMRSFVMQEDAGVLMCSYPEGTARPDQPFPYFTEVMTGFEYTLAAGLIQEGDRAAGEKIVRSIRDRYDGRRRNPFDEAECGRHYARALVSWSAFTSWNPIETDGRKDSMSAQIDQGVQAFWSSGFSCGTLRRNEDASLTLTVIEGTIRLSSLTNEDRHYSLEREVFPVGTYECVPRGD